MTEEINYWNVHEITLQPPLEEEVLEISVMQWLFKSIVPNTTHVLERKFEMKNLALKQLVTATHSSQQEFIIYM